MKGYLFTFEGGEAAGKGTQIKLLKEKLIHEGYKVSDVDLYEPGSTPVGDICRIIVKNKVDKIHLEEFENIVEYIKDQDITALSQLFLFLTSRSEIYDKKIKPELEEGKIILLDRSVDSSTVYQGYAQNPDLVDLIRMLNEKALGDVRIAKTFLLDLPVDVSLKRMVARDGDEGDRFQDWDKKMHEKLRQGYLSEAQFYADRIEVVDGNRTIEDIYEDIYSVIKNILS